MPILSPVGRKSLSNRLFVLFLYGGLSFFGATMAIPFFITLTSSNSNDFDYDRYSIVPRAIWSPEDRFVKGMVNFVNRYPNWFAVLNDQFPLASPRWTSWRAIGLDHAGSDKLANYYLNAPAAEKELWKKQAADYAEFAASYPVEDSLATFSNEQGAEFIAMRYQRIAEENPTLTKGRNGKKQTAEAASLEAVSEAWGVPITNFFAIRFETELRAPLGQQSWVPPNTPKQNDYNALRRGLKHGFGTPGVLPAWEKFLHGRGYSSEDAAKLAPLPDNADEKARALWVEFSRDQAPASPVIPYPARMIWMEFLASDEVRTMLNFPGNEGFDIARYNTLAGTSYSSLRETPFPLPAQGFDGIRPLWNKFIESRFPLRLTKLQVTPELTASYQQFLQRYPSLDNVNQLLGTKYAGFNEFPLEAQLPQQNGPRAAWMDFVKSLPSQERILTSSENTYQAFLLQKYGSVEAVNAAYGWKLGLIEEARPPFDKAYAITYEKNQTAFTWAPLTRNYHAIIKFLLNQGNAIPVTLWLIILSVFMTLTVNPIAGYALSRFNLSGKDKIILFCLATSAFPAMVSAIPGYLLMRDLGLLNTFFALVLPGAANGMGIFILKGFFDSMPQELYEAATIDGAKEWQIFYFVTLPMVKPIMAINALNAFIGAYSGWEWALIICQDKDMWTLSVWLYQASQWWAATPWISTAGFVVASIPTLVVFLFCQNIIMKGIIVPSMK